MTDDTQDSRPHISYDIVVHGRAGGPVAVGWPKPGTDTEARTIHYEVRVYDAAGPVLIGVDDAVLAQLTPATSDDRPASPPAEPPITWVLPPPRSGGVLPYGIIPLLDDEDEDEERDSDDPEPPEPPSLDDLIE